MKTIGQAGIKLIKKYEGCRLKAYKPVPTEKYWTIGWGHYGPDVKEGMTITQAEADAMLERDLVRYVNYTNDKKNVPIIDKLTQNQFDALVSFCYNCGPGNLKKLCAGRTAQQIAASMPAYNKGGGKVLAGLVRRRAEEVALFNTPDPKPAKKEDEDVAQIEALTKLIEKQADMLEAQDKRIKELEKRVNVTGKQDPPKWAAVALEAAKKAGAITTTEDKGTAEIKIIQTLYNLGLFDAGALQLINNANKKGGK